MNEEGWEALQILRGSGCMRRGGTRGRTLAVADVVEFGPDRLKPILRAEWAQA